MYNVKPYFTLRNFHRSLLSFVLAFILFSISQFSVSTLLTDGRALARLLPKMPAAHAQSVITVTSASTMIAKDGDCTLPEAMKIARLGEVRIEFNFR